MGLVNPAVCLAEGVAVTRRRLGRATVPCGLLRPGKRSPESLSRGQR